MKEKVIRASARGITFSDADLFPIGTKVGYVVDREKKLLLISPNLSADREITVSRKKSGDKYLPLVDIRNKEVLALFATAEKLYVEIHDEEVIVTAARSENEQTSYVFDKTELFEAAGIDAHTETLAQAVTIASFFSGAGILDEGFRQIKDFRIVYAFEKNPNAALTYQKNHGEHIVVGDITELDPKDVPPVKMVIGGSPCQGFTPTNRRTNYLDNPNNYLLKEYLRVIKGIPTCEVFVLENVPELLTAGGGQFLKEIMDYLDEFHITYGVLNAASFGTAQSRRRAILIGSKVGEIALPQPTHEPHEHVSVAEALQGLTDDIVNQLDVSKPSASTAERMACIKQGENWEVLPNHLRGNMRKGKTHSNILRRLRADMPAIALPNVRKSNILHPFKDRILSIRELARLFDLPDTYEFVGLLSEMQQQLANAVPVRLAKSVARQIQKAYQAIRPSKESALLDYINGLEGWC